jgi:hypothetical protein
LKEGQKVLWKIEVVDGKLGISGKTEIEQQ